jgi:erythromycin esterase
MTHDGLVSRIRRARRPLREAADLDPLLDRVGDARLVLLGEASHGTSEFYTWRQAISERLVRERGFSFIAVEGDWPDCYRVNRFVRGFPDSGRDARQVLGTFTRWPTWMWANEEVVALVEWLRRHNERIRDDAKVGFYGLDVYSLWDSMDAVVRYLQRIDPEAARAARTAYGCFDPYGEDAQDYARATRLVPTSCEDETVAILLRLRRRAPEYREDGREAFFDAEQNALVARSAELYYRTMMRGGPTSWNVRDTHMVETLERLLDHHGPDARAIVWEHNTHIGDARATSMATAGMVNVGQLAREQWGDDDVVLVGFSSHRGSVIAGEEWGAPMRRVPVPAAREGSWDDLLHRSAPEDGLLLLEELADAPGMDEPRGHRAIGVVYTPERESYGNYVPTLLGHRYDALLHVEESRALEPLPVRAEEEPDAPDTYPFGE